MEHHDVLVVGGGNGGVSLAARLLRDGVRDIALVSPSPVHRYRPLLNYVGAGEAAMADLERPMRDVVPDGCTWIRDGVEAVDAANSTVRTRRGRTLHWSTLVLSRALDRRQRPGRRRPGGPGRHRPRDAADRRYPSIWAIGDAAALGTRSSGGALRHQVQVLAHNLAAAQDGRKPMRRYDGYTVVPITVSRRRLLLVEVDRDGRPAPSVPLVDLAKPRRATWLLDRYALPVLYWRRLLRGKVRSSPAVIRADSLTRTLSARPAGPRPRTRPLPGRRLIR